MEKKTLCENEKIFVRGRKSFMKKPFSDFSVNDSGILSRLFKHTRFYLIEEERQCFSRYQN